MSTTIVTNATGDVRVMNLPARLTYYRGRYYRTVTTQCVTPTEFRSFNRATYFAHSTGLRHFLTEGDLHAFYNTRYDSSRCTWNAPF